MRKLIIIIVFVLVACAPPSIKPVATDAITPTSTPVLISPTKPVPTQTPRIITVTGGTYHIRDMASETSDIVGYAYIGDEFELKGETDNWYQVPGGWINKGCCE